MSTKTMRLPPRRVLTADQPRRNGEHLDAVKRPTTATPFFRNPTSAQTGPSRTSAVSTVPSAAPSTVSAASYTGAGAGAAELTRSNQLLAGYLAHEFLTSRTLFGEPWEPPARAAGVQAADSTKRDRAVDPPPPEEKRRKYAEVCHMLKVGETHLPGVVNPSQLAGILKL